MYKWFVSGLLVIILIWACGCTLALPGAKQGTLEENPVMTTPTLPRQYVAGEYNEINSNSPIEPTQTPMNLSTPFIQTAAKINITVANLTCSNCTNGTISSGGNLEPLSSFTVNPSFGLAPLSVQFTDTSINQPTSWLWMFGDGGSSNQENPVYTFTTYGVFPVVLYATNIYGTASSQSVMIYVCPLVASFTANPTNGLIPLSVQFTDTSTDAPTSWTWSFGDGSTSTQQNPVHTYTSSGSFNVTLTATNKLGSCWNTSVISVAPIVASFTAKQTNGLVPPLTVQFTDTSTDAPTSWTWSFGDGSTSTQQNPVHTYTSSGSFNVTLTATKMSASGIVYGTSSSNQIITVDALPIVSFTYVITNGPSGPTISFNDNSTGFPNPTSWYWDFGDGFNSIYQNPSHQYAISGSYTVKHSATNSLGTNWSNMTVTIS